MKLIITAIAVILINNLSSSQNQGKQVFNGLEKTIGLKKALVFEDLEIKFDRVISDSRCPINATCIRAGEAIVKISIYKNDTFVKDKIITISASGLSLEEFSLIFSTETFKIVAIDLDPYPNVSAKDNDKKDFKLKLMIKLLDF